MTRKNVARLLLTSTVLAGGLSPFHANAQTVEPTDQTQSAPGEPATPSPQAGPAAGDADIIVTARRRDETSIAVPVSLTAVGGAELERRGIVTVDALARLVPSLIVGEGGGTPQGGIIAIRGLSGADSNTLGDQAVSFNIDGVQVARASVRRLSQMDIAQVEVLKGPQALFFGKNSPAGIISVRTADPTSSFAAKLQTGYEFHADETRTEGYVSGPLTDNLGVRLAGYYSHQEGDIDYVRSPNANFPALRSRVPLTREVAARGTMKWEPSDRFSARLKVSYNRLSGSSSFDTGQILSCPTGVPQSGSADDCKPNGKTSNGGLGPNFARLDPRFGDGSSFLRTRQWLSGLELNYDINDVLKLTSISGYYDVKTANRGNFAYTDIQSGAPPMSIRAIVDNVRIKEFDQEIRVTSSFDGPVNFLFGGFYQRAIGDAAKVAANNALAPTSIVNLQFRQKGTSYSVFGQALVDLTPTLELSGGARYSNEKKRLPIVRSGVVLADIPSITGSYDGSWVNLSPEATLSWRPSRTLTVYGSYKEGFLSGGFNTGSANFTQDLRYDQQLISGFEGGVKASLLNGTLRTNLGFYTYKTDGLQLSVNFGGLQTLRNAGSVRTQGVDFDVSYTTPLKGLTLNGAVSYLDGRYIDYQGNCYRGASSSVCFNQVNRTTGAVGLLQDLSGTELLRSPTWSGNAGFVYQGPITQSLDVTLTGNATHTSSYLTDASSAPGGRQGNFGLYDASVAISPNDDRWELALVGRNLANKYYFVRSLDADGSGTAGGSALVGRLGDTVGPVSRGREIMLRATVKFGS